MVKLRRPLNQIPAPAFQHPTMQGYLSLESAEDLLDEGRVVGLQQMN